MHINRIYNLFLRYKIIKDNMKLHFKFTIYPMCDAYVHTHTYNIHTYNIHTYNIHTYTYNIYIYIYIFIYMYKSHIYMCVYILEYISAM